MLLTGFGPTASFAENTVNAAPQLLDADVVFTSGTSLAGGRLVMSGLLAQDRVSVLTQGNGAGQIGFDGTTVSYGGVAFGTATGGEGAAFTITFNAEATSAAVDALIERLSYANVSNAPTTTRMLKLDVVDGAGTGLPIPTLGISVLTPLTGTANPFNGFNAGSRSAPSFVDLDGDGRLDLVSGDFDGTFQAWRNTTPLPPPPASITITVTAETEGPTITSANTANYAENGTATAYQAMATGTVLTWSLSGTDADLFNISNSGAVTFRAAPNFEAPADAGGNNVYEVNVTASDGTLTASQSVAITVTDILDGVYRAGSALADNLAGTDQDDTLVGLAGYDTLNGGLGADRMVGGLALQLRFYLDVVTLRCGLMCPSP